MAGVSSSPIIFIGDAITEYLAGHPDPIKNLVPIKIAGMGANSIVIQCFIPEIKETVAVRIEKDGKSEPDDASTIGSILSNISPSFAKLYGVYYGMGPEFYVDSISGKSARGFLTAIAPLTLPPLSGPDFEWEQKNRADVDPRTIYAYPIEYLEKVVKMKMPSIHLKYTVIEYIPTTYWEYISKYKDEKEAEAVKNTILIKVAKALLIAQEAHEFEHNDLHTENIMMKEDGTPVIIDFDYSRIMRPPSGSPLVGERLKSFDPGDVENYNYPANPLTDPIRVWYDIAVLSEGVFAGQSTPYSLNLFFGSHGIKYHYETKRPLYVMIPLTLRHFLAYLDNPRKYLRELYK